MTDVTFSHDEFAWKLASAFLEDFKPFVRPLFYDAANAALAARNVVAVRALTSGKIDDHQPYQLKTERQICDLFKKFSFSQDLYTPSQLREDSIKKFMDNQERLMVHEIPDDPLTRSIVFGARGYIDQILGDFSSLEICEKATFGKKSSVGIPMRKACEGERYEAPITGSCDHIDWFDKYYSAWNRPAFLYAESRAVLRKKPPYRNVDVLEATLVDKTWKSLRMIMPNTTIGTLYSSGLGRVVEGKLRTFGYDIRHLQPVHGELAKFGSITGSLVTADQSLASDNITETLIDRLFPRKWAQAFKLGRIEEMALYGRRFKTPTFMTMGIGFTFPLQTLVFLAILLAIRDYCELDEQTVVSVFGDDLIYDVRMHEIVSTVFPSLGLLINADKTFADGFFRESCGQDYFRGIDVRPFHLGRVLYRNAGKRRVEAYLYTAFNGVARRWQPYEVPSVTNFIIGEIRRIKGEEVLLVPLDYPDTAGCKLSPSDSYILGIERKIRKNNAGWYSFRFLSFEADTREENRHDPYYFLALKRERKLMELPFPKKFGAVHGDLIDVALSPFTEVEDVGHSQSVVRARRKSGSRRRPKLTHIPQQDMGRYKERPGVSGNWALVGK